MYSVYGKIKPKHKHITTIASLVFFILVKPDNMAIFLHLHCSMWFSKNPFLFYPTIPTLHREINTHYLHYLHTFNIKFFPSRLSIVPRLPKIILILNTLSPPPRKAPSHRFYLLLLLAVEKNGIIPNLVYVGS